MGFIFFFTFGTQMDLEIVLSDSGISSENSDFHGLTVVKSVGALAMYSDELLLSHMFYLEMSLGAESIFLIKIKGQNPE